MYLAEDELCYCRVVNLEVVGLRLAVVAQLGQRQPEVLAGDVLDGEAAPVV